MESSTFLKDFCYTVPMRLASKPLSDYPLWLRPFFWNQKRKYGTILNPALLWGRVPKLFAAVAILFGVLDRKKSPLSPLLRALLTVRISQINHCSFCVDINSSLLLARGAEQKKLDALDAWRESSLFDGKERIALEYAEAVTRSDARVDEDLMVRVKRHFDGDHLLELTGLIAFQNMSSKFNAALDVEPQGFCSLDK